MSFSRKFYTTGDQTSQILLKISAVDRRGKVLLMIANSTPAYQMPGVRNLSWSVSQTIFVMSYSHTPALYFSKRNVNLDLSAKFLSMDAQKKIVANFPGKIQYSWSCDTNGPNTTVLYPSRVDGQWSCPFLNCCDMAKRAGNGVSHFIPRMQ